MFEIKSDETGNIFTCSEEMPCTPGQLQVLYWGLPGLSRRCQPETYSCPQDIEEAAARLIAFSQAVGVWVGVSWSRIVEMQLHDIGLHTKALDAPLKGAVAPSFPASVIYTGGTRRMFLGFSDLRDERMVRIERIGETSIFYPTEKLVRQTMQVQGITA